MRYITEYKARLANYFVNTGIFASSYEYTPFIILTRSRSGSNYLVDLLNSHPAIKCFNEVFSRSGETYWGVPGYGSRKHHSNSIRLLKKDHPASFLTQYIYTKMPTEVSAVGFKLLYNQAQKGNTRKLWSYLRQVNGLRIIHLKRKNLLKVVASKKLAEVNNEWVRRGGEKGVISQSIELSVDECVEQFQKTRDWQQKYDEYFKSSEMIEITYEDLATDTVNVMTGVQSFLQVDVHEFSAKTCRQSSGPIQDTVRNYESLKEHFSGTEWEEIFE